MKIRLLFIFCILFFAPGIYAQNSSTKSAEITAADFAPAFYNADSSAPAVVLYDGGTAKYEADDAGAFNVIYTYHRRLRIMNKNAWNAATVDIPLYNFGSKFDEMDKFDAATYTFDNGNVIKTKVDKESVYKDKVTSNITVKKFTFPNLKEGCIIDYSYRLTSPLFFSLKAWQFQEEYPVLKSEYETFVPTMFNFVLINTGYYDLQPVTDETNEQYRIHANAGNIINYNAVVLHSKWTLKNLAPMVKEKYTTTVKNYMSAIDFQLRSINPPNGIPQPFMRSWDELVKEMMKSDRFGADLSSKNNWLEDDMTPLINKNDSLETAKNIYNYIRENFSCTYYSSTRMQSTLKEVYHARKGDVAEINLLLTAMLRKANLQADPVLLSTRENGFANENYPLIDKFNYVISRVVINGTEYLLDASRKKMGFNALPAYCYNGYAPIISSNPVLIPLFADSLKEPKKTVILISNSVSGSKLNGTFNSDLGYHASCELRDSLSGSGAVADFFTKLKSSYTSDIEIINEGIDSLNDYNNPVSVHYDFSLPFDEDIVYFNPLLAEGYKTNPFAAATRNYPVEMPLAPNESISVYMEIPKGYRVDELPKSERLNFDEANSAVFQYIINADSKMIQLTCKLNMNRTDFNPEDYETLRQFYSEIVKKEAEQIVFKKIK